MSDDKGKAKPTERNARRLAKLTAFAVAVATSLALVVEFIRNIEVILTYSKNLSREICEFFTAEPQSRWLLKGIWNQPIRFTTEVSVELENRAHPNPAKGYTVDDEELYYAEPGAVILKAWLINERSNEADCDVGVSKEEGAAVVSCTLTSGPKIKPWDAWLYGALMIEQEMPPGEYSIAEVQGEGRVRLPVWFDLEDVDQLRLLDLDGQKIWIGPPQQAIDLKQVGLTLTFDLPSDAVPSVVVSKLSEGP